MRWQAVFFDFDGVILDSVNIKTEAFAEMFRQYGPDIEAKVVDYHVAHGGVSRFEKFKYYYKNFLNQPVDENLIQKLAQQFSQLVIQKVLKAPFIDGALETLKELKSMNIPIYLVTATPEDEMLHILKKRNLVKYFSKIYGAPKPKNAIVENILHQGNYNATQCLYIGDAMSDYLAAKKNNVEFLGIVKKGAKLLLPESIRTSFCVTFELN